MANIKISALPAATFVNDADLIPIVQSGVTKKVTPAILLENLWAETTAINGLIDGILATPASSSLYTSSGTLFNNGIAQAKNFLFKTSTDVTFNPSGTYHEMRFNGSYNETGGYSTSEPGAFGMKGAGINNKLVLFNMHGGATPLLQMMSVDTVESRTRFFNMTSDSAVLGTETGSGLISLRFTNNGADILDQRSTTEGLTYAGNYSVDIITRDRSIPDVGTVKSLITANAASIYTASGNVFNTGVATTRRFDFVTDQDAVYNSGAENIKLSFNAYSDHSNNVIALPGTLSIKAQKTGNVLKYASFNIFSVSETIELLATDISLGERRIINVSPIEANIFTDTSTGNVQLLFNSGGGFYVDNRSTKLGLRYNADYSADLVTVDRAMTDVGIVKKLRQQANTWTTAGRPAVVAGVFGFNTTTSKFEGYNGTAWVDLA